MRIISETKYTADGRPYVAVELTEEEERGLISLQDLLSGRLENTQTSDHKADKQSLEL